MDKRKILYVVIIIICIIAVNYAIYWQFFRAPDKEENTVGTGEITPVVEEGKILKDFNNIFNNGIDYQQYEIQGLSKIDNSKDMIYTGYESEEKQENKYELNVNIPVVNINSSTAVNINNQIEDLFETKATNVLAGTTQKTIYTVEYEAYINANILSLVIKSTLKEGDNPQRVIVKTYVYNLSTNEILTLPKVLEIKNLSSTGVKKEIISKIEEATVQANKLQELGYSVYKRDVNSSMYEIENTTSFFLGKDNSLYILYPYGNSNNTSEIDIIMFE